MLLDLIFPKHPQGPVVQHGKLQQVRENNLPDGEDDDGDGGGVQKEICRITDKRPQQSSDAGGVKSKQESFSIN